MKKRILHLALKEVFFRRIERGEKLFEYRRKTPHWRKRIENRVYDEIHLTLGYPKKGDPERTLIRPWRGYEEQTITHEHFNMVPEEVFALRVN
ncbi:ASCH domain-containing protein [Vibrio furnissii]|uniref:ASCH domain-containing protein n=1 Tax=Vibrio furnissii TaxID=29494 RepID=UPI0013028207|nr:ASCH domain-containing protein [Vibrio furnissii]